MAERENLPQIVAVPDIVCQEVGSQMTWGLGNQLFVYAGKSAKQQEQNGAVGTISKVHEVKWDTDMHNPIARKLVNETHDIFMKVQQMRQERSAGTRPNMLKFSREYRSVLKACIMDVQFALEKHPAPQSAKDLNSQLQLMEMTELIWNLCEILFVETLPGGIVLLQLLDWLRMHFTEAYKIAADCISLEDASEHPSYWQAVTQFVLQGSIEEARRLLAAHSNRSQPIQLLDQLLKNMPVFTAYPGHSLAEFEMKWQHWQQECIHRLHSGEFVSDENLETLCQILCGEDEVFVKKRNLMGNWYCMLISRLLYQNPAVKAFDLQYHTQFCISAYGGNKELQPWDSILLAALEFDVHQVIRESSYGSNLREFLLLEYATSLMSHYSLWQISADYLDNCPEFGRYYLEQFVEHLPIETERKANKVLHLCGKRNMHDQIQSICKTMGMKALHNQRMGSALSWGLRSKDAAFVSFLAEKFLTDYSETGDFSNIDLIDNLGSSMLLSGKLTFLGKYREFHRLYHEKDFHAAAALLLSLLTARVAPKKFWPILLTDALPLLEAEKVIFDSQQTYELMHCLEESNLSTDLQSTQTLSEVEHEKQGLMKLALARNLARAIVQEGTETCS